MNICNMEEGLKEMKKRGMKTVMLQFVDIQGNIKSVEIPISELKNISEGLMFDGSSINGFANIYQSDMTLKPDPSTLTICPWHNNTARIICDVYKSNGEIPFKGDPRYILKKNLKKLKNFDAKDFEVGVELEYHLLEKEDFSMHDEDGYFNYTPNNTSQKIRNKITQAMIKTGIDCEAFHHEAGPSQHEIDLKFNKALKIADSILTTKIITKYIAKEYGLIATFMPKPYENGYGSGMHLHLNLANNINLFKGKKTKKLSDKGLSFLAGLIEHSKALTAITNPTVNSYKRLIPGYEAPVYISWGLKNRSTMIRIPSSKEEARRLEYRSTDPSANPYLVLASILSAGLDGIEKDLKPPKPLEKNVYKFNEKEASEKNVEFLPSNLKNAINELKKDKIIKNSLGKAYEHFIKQKESEWEKYKTKVSEWERDTYIDV